ncbi:hypothetical protein TNIN_343341 [Trichonephila inaurata madagascariensis]|uniref:Uncharacterized protein n=1 Tax=Trichonephila inaurata madagascariensis TaxID=2747483 RepID=A0A8X6XEY7_9ARAC|nr:hypothetical protein TNIN_343341 [Trichonephila inaurata madagascariensis]
MKLMTVHPSSVLASRQARLVRGSTCVTHKNRARKELCSVHPLVMFVDLNEGWGPHEREMCYDFCSTSLEVVHLLTTAERGESTFREVSYR